MKEAPQPRRHNDHPRATWIHEGKPPPWARRGGPPPWMTGGTPPPWRRGRRRVRRALFWRFVAVFGVIVLLVVGGMALLAWLLARWTGGGQQVTAVVWVAGCGLALALPLLAALVATRAFRSIATPLADVMSAADAVAAGDLSVRVAERGSPEFRQLARSFNRMAGQLQQSDQQRRTMMADVAHELRTPLHIIQGNLEGVADGVYAATPEHIEATLDETRLLARLVEDLRTLSLAEAGQLPMRWEAVDVADLLRDAATSFSGQAEAAGVGLVVDIQSAPDALTVTADYHRLDQVLGNLIANALRHTPTGGTITLCGRADLGGVVVEVSDTGAGIAPDELPHIFDRFWSRGAEGKAGSGLGLAIARSIVEAHGGVIEADSEPGQGTTMRVRLPGPASTMMPEVYGPDTSGRRDRSGQVQ